MADKILGQNLTPLFLVATATTKVPDYKAKRVPVNISGVPVTAAAQADSVAADNTALRADFNALLAKLRAAKVINT